jgi:hypothetical protein
MANKKNNRGSYIPDDHPDVIKKQEQREKAKEFTEKVADLVPFKTKKFKKKLKEEKESESPKLSTTKYIIDSKINRKAKKRTETEGSFAKGGRAGYKYGGAAIKGVSKILRKGRKV